MQNNLAKDKVPECKPRDLFLQQITGGRRGKLPVGRFL